MCTFTTTCPRCGTVSLVPEQIALRVFPDGSGEDFYAFACPSCGERVRKEADAGVCRLLRAGGVRPIETVAHPEVAPPDLPPISHDDLQELRELLQHHDWLAAHVV